MFQVKESESVASLRRIPVLLHDLSDGYTPEVGILAPTIEVSKNGEPQAAGTGVWGEVGDGVYYYEFALDEVDTTGWVNLRVVKAATTREYQAIVLITAYDPFDAEALGLSGLEGGAGGGWDEEQEELESVPLSTATLRDMIKWLFAVHRNKRTQTATQAKLYKDDGSTVLAKATTSDDATTTMRQEWVDGP